MPKATTSPAYLMYPSDILSSGRVSALEPLEELWYRRAIDLGWPNGGMPADAMEFAGWVGRGCTVEAAEKIISKFYKPKPRDPSKVVNRRQEKERKAFAEKTRKNSESGLKAAKARWEKDKRVRLELETQNKTSKNEMAVIDDKQTTSADAVALRNDAIPIPISISISNDDLKRLIDACVRANATLDERLVEVAVIETLMRRKTSGSDDRPINSIRYFDDEIRHLSKRSSDLTSATIDTMLAVRRSQIPKLLGAEQEAAVC